MGGPKTPKSLSRMAKEHQTSLMYPIISFFWCGDFSKIIMYQKIGKLIEIPLQKQIFPIIFFPKMFGQKTQNLAQKKTWEEFFKIPYCPLREFGH